MQPFADVIVADAATKKMIVEIATCSGRGISSRLWRGPSDSMAFQSGGVECYLRVAAWEMPKIFESFEATIEPGIPNFSRRDGVRACICTRHISSTSDFAPLCATHFSVSRLSLGEGESDFRPLGGGEGLVVTLGPNTSFFDRPSRSVCRWPGTKTIPRQSPHPLPKRSWIMNEFCLLLRFFWRRRRETQPDRHFGEATGDFIDGWRRQRRRKNRSDETCQGSRRRFSFSSLPIFVRPPMS